MTAHKLLAFGLVACVVISLCRGQAPDKMIHCLECDRVASPEDCHNQIECLSGEVCMVEQYVTREGHIFFDMGCKMASTCSAGGYLVSPAEIQARIQSQATDPGSNPLVGRKRQGMTQIVHTCEECCETDYCNNYLCGGHALTIPDKQLHCLQCDRVARPEDCHNQIECLSGEVCMAERYVTGEGHIFYDMGCKMASTCSAAGYVVSPAEIQARIQSQTSGPGANPVVGRKRQGMTQIAHTCEECCETDYCNNYLCGGHVTKNLKCLSCTDIASMDFCDTIQTCHPHEVCYIQEEVTDTFQLLYNSGCMREVQCQGFLDNLQSMGGFSFEPCVNCCNDSFCNAHCPVGPIMTTTTPIPTGPTTICPPFPLSQVNQPKIIHNALVTLGCGAMEDIAFLVDNSKFISNQEEHWFEIFTRAFADTIDLSPDKARFAYTYYNTRIHNVITLDKGDNPTYVDAKLETLSHHRGALVDESDMDLAINTGMSILRNGRVGAAKYMVILTEADINDTQAALDAATKAKQDNITVIIIGIGNFTQEETSDLRAAVTSPSDTHLFKYGKFNRLRRLLEDIVLSKCEKIQVAPTLLPDPCSGPKLLNFLGCGAEEDITLLLDRSGSISDDDWKQIHTFVHNLVDKFNIAPNASRLGIMTFNDDVTELIQLHEFPDKTQLLAQIDTKLDALSPKGETYTAKALEKTIEWYENSGRPDAIKVAIVFTDGGSDTKFGTVAGALELHRRNVTTFVIGIGHDVDLKEQLIIASDPDVEHMINVKDVDGLLLYLDYLAAIRCRDIAHHSTSTAMPSTTTATSLLGRRES